MKSEKKPKMSLKLKRKLEAIKLAQREKKAEEEKKDHDKQTKAEKKESNKATGLGEGKIKELIHQNVREFGKEELQEIIGEFKSEIQKLREKGTLYRAEFLELKTSDVVKRGIKNIANDGYRYCFQIEDRLFFQREVRSGK